MKIKTDALRAERVARDLTQVGLAKLTGLSRATVQSVERGESKRLATIQRVAGALDLPVFDLALAEDEIERQALARLRELQES